MDEKLAVGVHFSANVLRASYVEHAVLQRMGDIEWPPQALAHMWFRPQPDRLACLDMQQLVGLQLDDANPEKFLQANLTRTLESLDTADGVIPHLGLVVSAEIQEFQRRHLLGSLSSPDAPLRVVDSVVAALYAVRHQQSCQDMNVVIVVVGDIALDLAVARIAQDATSVLSQHSIGEMSGRSLNNFLMELLLDRFPRHLVGRFKSAPDELFSEILVRLTKSRIMLGRMQSFDFPVRLDDQNAHAVKLSQSDISDFFAGRSELLREALVNLKEQANLADGVERVILVGDFGEFSDFTAQLEEELAPVEVMPISTLADGAALAAYQLPAEPFIPELPPRRDLTSFIRDRAQLIRLPSEEPSSATPEETAEQLFTQVAELIAKGQQQRARQLLSNINDRAAGVLSALSPKTVSAGPEHAADMADSEPTATERARLTAGQTQARRLLEEAERLLQQRRPLDAVRYSHSAHQASPEKEVLLAMLDIHRRSAELLSGPENFDAAVKQLQCALEHQSDELTKKALVDRYVQQALHYEQQGLPEEAGKLFEEALTYGADESAIRDHLYRLESE